jgi:hypothetical protein
LLFQSKKDKELTLKNSPLVSMKVYKKIDYKRYELFVNSKKIICISHKNLEVSKNYWCTISMDDDGIITLSNLQKQPGFFQQNIFFSFEIPFKKIIEDLNSHEFKSSYLYTLKSQKIADKNILNKFLFCLENDTLSYPLFLNNEKMLLQFKIINKNLNEKIVQYYFAFKNYGSFFGEIKKNSPVSIVSKYHIIDTDKHGGIIFKKGKKAEPLCEISKSILDIKG